MTELVNPVELLRRPRLPQGLGRRLVGDEEERPLAACAVTTLELADIVLVAIETAMRQGEILEQLAEHGRSLGVNGVLAGDSDPVGTLAG